MPNNSSFPAVLRDVVKSIDIFYSGPRPTATSEDFGSSKKLELMLKLGDSSSLLVIFWSQNNNGRFARCAFPQLLGDLSTRSPSPFRRFSIADPGDFAIKPYDFIRVIWKVNLGRDLLYVPSERKWNSSDISVSLVQQGRENLHFRQSSLLHILLFCSNCQQ